MPTVLLVHSTKSKLGVSASAVSSMPHFPQLDTGVKRSLVVILRCLAAWPEEGLKDASYDTSHGWLAPFVKFTLLQCYIQIKPEDTKAESK